MIERWLTLATQAMVILETVTLATLLINLALAGSAAVAAAVGPVHGIFYLSVIVVTLLNAAADRRAKALSVIPAVGGLLAVRRIRRHRDELVP